MSVPAGLWRRSSSVWLYVSFFVAGIGCSLPGALLPAMLSAWRLNDRGAGWLFLFLAAGSALGALALARELRRSAAFGFVLLALAAFAWSSRREFVSGAALLWGFGLGMVLTSLTLLRSQPRAAKSVELARVNLLWAAGACVCPVLLTHALHAGSPRGVLQVFAAVFVLLGLGILAFCPRTGHTQPVSRTPLRASLADRLSLRQVALPLIVATALSTGIEASAGAWLAAYAQRSQHTFAFVVAAPTCLWAGLLASRTLASFFALGPLLGESGPRSRRALRSLLALVALASLALLIPAAPLLLSGAFLLGFGLGPVYPVLLARIVGGQPSPRGAIFFLCGISSALLPWLTGALSAHFASLRAGLSVLAVGSFALLFAGIRLPSPDAAAIPAAPRQLSFWRPLRLR